jgi:CheY-like chemotaxis protein
LFICSFNTNTPPMKKLLILSTSQFTIDQLKNSLSHYNFELCLLTNPQSFFEDLHSCKPDLIILDFLLAEKNGGGICHQLKSDPATKDYPVIILSEFAERPERFGCDAIVMKPIADSELISLIHRHAHMVNA